VRRLLADHHVLIEPVHDADYTHEPGPDGLTRPGPTRIYHPNLGWVRGVGELEEDIKVGDLVIFVGWKQYQIPTRSYADRRIDWYVQHEDDIEVILEDWD
jgi:hypothetical protein